MALQTQLLEAVLDKFPRKADAVKALSDLLNMGQNGVYRRIRNESQLTPDELSLISKKFGISLDAIVQENSSNLFFDYPAVTEQVTSFEGYLNSISGNMEAFPHLPGVKVKYAASELPIFHYCFFPELMAFKLYTWGKATWDLPSIKDRPFSFDLISPAAYEAAQTLLQHYLNVPSIELWTFNIIDLTLNQIEYYLESGSIANPADALILCDKMKELIIHLKEMAIRGKKFPVGTKTMEGRHDFTLFLNEMIDTSNTIIVCTDLGKATYITFGNPNFLKGTDQRVAGYIDDWFGRIMVKSQPISSHAEKARNKYFNRLVQQVERKKARLALEV